MGIRSETQTVIECDNCSNIYVEAMKQKETKKIARSQGWVISKDVKCPECVANMKKYGVPG